MDLGLCTNGVPLYHTRVTPGHRQEKLLQGRWNFNSSKEVCVWTMSTFLRVKVIKGCPGDSLRISAELTHCCQRLG